MVTKVSWYTDGGLRSAQRRLQREQEPKSPFVFTSGRGSPFTTTGFRANGRTSWKRVKLGGVNRMADYADSGSAIVSVRCSPNRHRDCLLSTRVSAGLARFS